MMRSRLTTIAMGIALGSAASLGCQKSSEHEATEAAQASLVAQQKSERVMRELERGDHQGFERATRERETAGARAAAEAEDVGTAVDRERSRFRVLLTKEIAWIDRRVIDLEKTMTTTNGAVRSEQQRDIADARTWRDRLQRDLDAIDEARTFDDWSPLKARIERDLDEDRPRAIPRSYEKSYGI